MGGLDEKTRAHPLVALEIDFHATKPIQEHFFYDNIEALLFLNLIVFFKLVQSQAQVGPSSTVSRNIYAYGFLAVIYILYDNSMPNAR